MASSLHVSTGVFLLNASLTVTQRAPNSPNLTVSGTLTATDHIQ